MKHTATQWTLKKVDNLPAECGDDVIRYCYPGFRIHSPDGGIAAIWNQTKDTQAKAEFIVRACNNHDELLEALKGLAKHVDLSKLNIKRDFSLLNAHAYATKMIAKVEERG